MNARRPCDESVVEAMCAELAPYPWRGFAPELFARFALAAGDRHRLETVLATVQGAEVGPWERLEPAGRDDARVAQLVGLLADHRWTELSLRALCRDLASHY